MGIALAIDAEYHAFFLFRVSDPGGRIGVPPVDLGQDRFRVRHTGLIFWIPPIESTQRLIDGIGRFLCFGDQTDCQLMHEPLVRSTISRRFNRFLTPLQKALCVRECAVVLGVTGRGEKEDFRFDLLRFQFAAFNLRRIGPKRCRFDLHHIANNEPF